MPLESAHKVAYILELTHLTQDTLSKALELLPPDIAYQLGSGVLMKVQQLEARFLLATAESALADPATHTTSPQVH